MGGEVGAGWLTEYRPKIDTGFSVPQSQAAAAAGGGALQSNPTHISHKPRPHITFYPTYIPQTSAFLSILQVHRENVKRILKKSEVER